MESDILSGILIVGVACLIVGFIGGFKIGRKSGDKIVADVKRRQHEAESLLLDVKSAAEKGADDLEKAGAKVKDHVEKIFGSDS